MKKKLKSILALVAAACIAMTTPVFGAGLTRDDFRINNSSADVLSQYGGDTIDALQALYGNNSDFYFYNLNPGSTSICRNVVLGVTTRSELIDQFGYAPYYTFDASTDSICTEKMYSQENAADLAQIFPNLDAIMVYNYKNLYQMAFYLDRNDVVQLLYVFNYLFYMPGESTIKNAQTLLNTFGYDCGTPDGKLGQNTTNAITAYQNAKGIYASGAVDNELLDALFHDVDSTGVDTDLFLQRYNEAIDTFNAEPDAAGSTSVHITMDDLKNDVFAPTGNLHMSVNPDMNYYGHIISCKGWVQDRNSLNGMTAAGEMMAMIYAFDPSIPDCETALQIFGLIREQSPVEHDGILFENISGDGNAAVSARYCW